MKTFVMMTKLCTHDALLVEVGSKLRDRAKNARAWLLPVDLKKARNLAHYALLGQWDFMDIYEAPDDETAAKVSMLSRAHGCHIVESWSAIPYERILELSEQIEKIKGTNTVETK